MVYGENEAEYGNPINTTLPRDKKFYTYNKLKDIYLAGLSYKDLINKFNISPKDLETYLPEEEKNINKAKVEVHYLGYYLNGILRTAIIMQLKMEILKYHLKEPRTYSRYNSIDEKLMIFIIILQE